MKLDYLTPALARVRPGWQPLLQTTQLSAIDHALAARHEAGESIYPPREQILAALSYHDPADTRIVILGQDPYHGAHEAMGLSFSVPADVRIPPSLRNIYKEIASDLDCQPPSSGDLSSWAQQGVLLLNSVLTVSADQAGSHGKIGWQAVSDALIHETSVHSAACVFMLWGSWAHGKRPLIDADKHLVLTAPHPSPLSAYRGFFGCRHFSQANAWLQQRGHAPIHWCG